MRIVLVTLAVLCLLGCGGDDGGDKSASDPVDAAASGCEGATDKAGCPQKGEVITHQFPDYTLKKFQEVSPCIAWTLNNEKALYVRGVTLSNQGAFHHSNWFVVPDSMVQGKDGYFKCKDRKFDEVGSAIASTEEGSFSEGLRMKVLPQAIAMGYIHSGTMAGKLKGVMPATTPSG